MTLTSPSEDDMKLKVTGKKRITTTSKEPLKKYVTPKIDIFDPSPHVTFSHIWSWTLSPHLFAS